MTQDVLTYGDEQPPRRWSRPAAVVVAVAVLVAGGVAIARARGSHSARGPGYTGYPTASPTPSEVTFPNDDLTFALTVAEPAEGSVTGLLMPDGTPFFLVENHGVVHALDAVAGPAHAPVLLGWCAPLRRFEDASAGYVVGSFLRLPSHTTRHVDGGLAIGSGADVPTDAVTEPAPHAHCPQPVTYPPLPPRTKDVHSTSGEYRRVTGRYFVSHETRAFCAAVRPAGCADQGWETYGESTLPPTDLAGSYTWEGDFLVRADARSGLLEVMLLPGVRLVRSEQVGVRVELGHAKRTYRKNGVLHLVVDAYDFPVREDAGIVLGRGITGLGRPEPTTETLHYFVSLYPDQFDVYVVLDAHERAIRVVCPEEGLPTIPDDSGLVPVSPPS